MQDPEGRETERKGGLRLFRLSFLVFLLAIIATEMSKLHMAAGPGEQKFGILALGGFVGWLLGLALSHSKATLKAVITALGAALGGAPVAFMRGVSDKWMYPVGLIVGLLWIRLGSARSEIVESSGSSRKVKRKRLFAWLDVIVILVVTVLCTIYAFVTAS